MDCNTCKNDRRLQLTANMNCPGCKAWTWAAQKLARNNVDSHGLICVDWIGGAFVRAQSLRSCQMNKCRDYLCLHDYHVVCSIHTSEHSVNIRTSSAFEKLNKCHFMIIISCVESTIRKIRLSGKIGLRITFAVGHTLFFFAWIKFEFFIIFWLRHLFIIAFVIIRYTKNFSKYHS